MSGVLLNIIAVIIGTVIGVTLGRFVKERFHEISFQAIGLCVMAFAVMMMVNGISGMTSGGMGDYALLAVVASLVAGSLIGEAIGIERWLEKFGVWLQKTVHKSKFFSASEDTPNTMVEGFMAASLLYCVGAMTVLGSIQDGLGDHATLYLKSALDGFSAIALATALGPGVGFSVIPIAVIQGSLALGAASFESVFTPAVISGITAVGGILIFAIALDILSIKRVRVGNMLPAIFIAGILGGFFG